MFRNRRTEKHRDKWKPSSPLGIFRAGAVVTDSCQATKYPCVAQIVVVFDPYIHSIDTIWLPRRAHLEMFLFRGAAQALSSDSF